MGILSFLRSRKKAKPAEPAQAGKEVAKPEGPEDAGISFKDEMMIVMHCPECGKPLEGSSRVCRHCGAKLG